MIKYNLYIVNIYININNKYIFYFFKQIIVFKFNISKNYYNIINTQNINKYKYKYLIISNNNEFYSHKINLNVNLIKK